MHDSINIYTFKYILHILKRLHLFGSKEYRKSGKGQASQMKGQSKIYTSEFTSTLLIYDVRVLAATQKPST